MLLPLALCTPVGKNAVLSIGAHSIRFLLTQALLIGLRTIPLCVLDVFPAPFAEVERWYWPPGTGTCGEVSNRSSMIAFPATQESSCQGFISFYVALMAKRQEED